MEFWLILFYWRILLQTDNDPQILMPCVKLRSKPTNSTYVGKINTTTLGTITKELFKGTAEQSTRVFRAQLRIWIDSVIQYSNKNCFKLLLLFDMRAKKEKNLGDGFYWVLVVTTEQKNYRVWGQIWVYTSNQREIKIPGSESHTTEAPSIPKDSSNTKKQPAIISYQLNDVYNCCYSLKKKRGITTTWKMLLAYFIIASL